MKLPEKINERASFAAKRYAKLKDIFGQFFAESARCLGDARSPVKGVDLVPSLDANYFDASFVGMKIRFLFSAQYNTDNSLMGQIVALRENQKSSNTLEVIGRLSFDGQGITDFEEADGNEKLEITHIAPEIILHFFEQALSKPMF